MLPRNYVVSNMELDSVWGIIKTRSVASRMSRQEHILLKDSPSLKPLIEWLRVSNIKTVSDIKPTCHQKRLLDSSICFEVKFAFEDDIAFPKIIFSNSIPLEGNFQVGIPECLKILYDIMYNPDTGYIPEVIFNE